jgi:16S rRNA (adenine1518-N6/adenine1519-N6)-dimethyltransferase
MKKKTSSLNFSPRAKKSLGQNFLVDENIVERIVRALQPRPDETLIEIGAGGGALTSRLIEGAGRLVALEFDRELVPLLRERFKGQENFTLIEGDALATDYCLAIKPAERARVVANLPYNISTAILQRLIEQRACLTELILMLQREVVERIMAQPATSERGFLSVFVQAYCEVESLFDVAPTAFLPVPKVWSTVVRLRPRSQLAFTYEDEAWLWRIVSAGFAQRRKTILNNLRASSLLLKTDAEGVDEAREILAASNIEPQRRAETLTLEEWVRLSRSLRC